MARTYRLSRSVQQLTSGSAGGVERQHGLHLDVAGGRRERLEHELEHALAVLGRVERRLGEQYRVFTGVDAQAVV